MAKRGLDILGSALGLVVLAPVFLLIAMAVKLTSPGPVLFRQYRMGRDGHLFQILKFRSMVDGAHRMGASITCGGDARITPLGAFLRRNKLDELPQLINVLHGDMSLVGPRPEIPEFREHFPHEFSRVLSVRPGITHRATLLFRDEEKLLGKADDPRSIYIDLVLPWKLRLYQEDLGVENLWGDLRTILATLFMRRVVVRPIVSLVDIPEVANISDISEYRRRREAIPTEVEEIATVASAHN